MAEQIKKSDIVQGEPFNDIAKEIRTALVEIEKFDRAAVSTSKAYAELTKNATKTVQSIQQVTHAQSESAKLMSEALAKKEYERKLLVEENKIKAEIAKQQARENKEREKAIKVQRDQNSEYKKLSDNTRRLKNESKDLGAQLLKLEANGQRNTKAYRDLAAQYRATTQAAKSGDTQLKKLDKTVGDNFRNVGNYKSALGGLKSVLGTLGIAFGARQIISFGKEAMELSRIQEKAVAQVAAGLASTNNAVGYSLDELKAKASALQKETLFGDETIMTDLTSVMLTFTNVTGEAFDRAQQSALDLSTRMGGDLKGAAVQLGKALNDPVRGVTALRKVGVSFTESQQEQIKVLTESGQLMAAQTIILDEMNHQFGGSAKAAAEADGGITQLSNAFGDAKEEIGKMLLEGLKPTIQGLKEFFENLSTEDIRGFVRTLGNVASVLGKVIKAFLAYKAVMFGLKMKDRIAEMISYNKALKNGTVTAEGATGGVKKFGAALKGIGLGLAIGLALELAQAFYDIASGAKDAREQQEALDRAIAKGSETANKVIENSSNRLKEQLRLLDLEMRQRKANGESEEKLNKEKLQREQDLTQEELKSVQQRIQFKEKAMAQTLKFEDIMRRIQKGELGSDKSYQFNIYRDEVEALLGVEKGTLNYATALNKLEQKSVRITQEIVELSNGKKDLLALTQELNVQLLEETATTNENTKAKTKNVKEIDNTKEKLAALQAALRKTADEYKKLAEVSRLSLDPDEVEKALALEHERKVLAADIAVIEAEIALSKAMQSGDAKKIEAAEKAVLEAKKEQIKAQLKLDLSTTDNVNEREKLIKQAELDELNLTTTVNETYKERFDTMRNIQQAITDVLQEQIDRRIELLGQEAEAAKSQQDYLTQLAANGNIYAQQSIAEQIEIQREAQAEQMRLERQKQNIELISQGLSTFNSELASGKSAPQALASTIVSTQALVGFLKNLNFFAKGTDNAPEGLAVVDEQGAEIITDSKGRIKDVGSNQGARFVNLKKGDKVLTATKTAQILESFGNVTNGQAMTKADKVGNSYDIMALNSGLNRIENAIKNKPEYTVHWDTYGAVERVRKGGDIVTNRYRK
jgi:myosin heavy subunit